MTWRPVALWAGLLATGVAVTGCTTGGSARPLSRSSTPASGTMTQTPAWNNPPASVAGRTTTATPTTPTTWGKPAEPVENSSGIQQVGGTALPSGSVQPGSTPMNPASPTGGSPSTSQFNPPANNMNLPSSTPEGTYSNRPS